MRVRVGAFGFLVARLLSPLILAKGTLSSPGPPGLRAEVAQGFLEKYGYLRQDEKRHSSEEVRSAVREFQWLSHLKVTGRLDGVTLQQMAAPRCGVDDGRSHSTWAQRVDGLLLGQHQRSKRYTQQGKKWYKRHLTYRIVNYPRHLSAGLVRLAVHTAFELWSNVSALAFREVTQGLADIRLAFFEGEHDDGTGNAFDGPGGALAHAFFPCRGEAHFDMAERWTLHSHKGHNLFMVAAHEIGHTLGLEHSPVRRALMSPYYKKLSKALVLNWDDIIAVQQLYGKPSSGQQAQSPGQVFMSALQDWELAQRQVEGPDSAPPQYCQGSFDAVTMDLDNTILVFRGGLFWVVSTQGNVSGPFPLQKRWPQLPLTIEAAAFSMLDKKLYFFKGRRMWRYSDKGLDPGFPRSSTELGLPRTPDCAFYYAPLGHMILFKGSRYFVLNLTTMQSEAYYPRGLADWKGLPSGANGALSRPDGYLYVFKEQQYWQFDPDKVRVTGDGLWAEQLEWIGCQRPQGSSEVL
ncbi:matrix metalloproteinase-28 [Arapaima gigas]